MLEQAVQRRVLGQEGDQMLQPMEQRHEHRLSLQRLQLVFPLPLPRLGLRLLLMLLAESLWPLLRLLWAALLVLAPFLHRLHLWNLLEPAQLLVLQSLLLWLQLWVTPMQQHCGRCPVLAVPLLAVYQAGLACQLLGAGRFERHRGGY